MPSQPNAYSAVSRQPSLISGVRPKRSIAAPINGIEITAATPVAAIAWPIWLALACNCVARYLGNSMNVELA